MSEITTPTARVDEMPASSLDHLDAISTAVASSNKMKAWPNIDDKTRSKFRTKLSELVGRLKNHDQEDIEDIVDDIVDHRVSDRLRYIVCNDPY
jgi:hypothetical protein